MPACRWPVLAALLLACTPGGKPDARSSTAPQAPPPNVQPPTTSSGGGPPPPAAAPQGAAEPVESAAPDASAPAVAQPSRPVTSPEPTRGSSGAPRGSAYRVAAIGDSLTDPKSHGGAYLAWVAARCPESTFENFAKGGAMVNQMRRRLEQEVLPDPPDAWPRYTHLVVFGGVNDVLSDQTAKRTPRLVARDLRAIFERAHARGLRAIAITMSPWGGFTKEWNPSRHAATLEINAWLRDQGRVGGVDHVVDAWALLSCGVETHLCADYVRPMRDGLHFGPSAHEKLGRALHQAAFADCR